MESDKINFFALIGIHFVNGLKGGVEAKGTAVWRLLHQFTEIMTD